LQLFGRPGHRIWVRIIGCAARAAVNVSDTPDSAALDDLDGRAKVAANDHNTPSALCSFPSFTAPAAIAWSGNFGSGAGTGGLGSPQLPNLFAVVDDLINPPSGGFFVGLSMNTVCMGLLCNDGESCIDGSKIGLKSEV
jgi:hypothetical protein